MSKRRDKRIKDPYAKREAEKYDNPIPSREYILQHLKARKVSLNFMELLNELNLSTDQNFEALKRRVKAMLRDGQLEQLPKKRYLPMRSRVFLEGIVTVDRKKCLWVEPKDGSARVSLPKFVGKRLFQGDRVVVSVPEDIGESKHREGRIVEILEQSNLVVTGRFIFESEIYYVTPYSKDIVQDIVIPPNKHLGAKSGQIVVVEVITQPSQRAKLVGHVVEILGDENTKGIEVIAALRKYQIPFEWPDDVNSEISKLQPNIVVSKNSSRFDLRELPLITIDGEDARDFDDAVFCEPKERGGWRLYVAIADVSHYVKPNTNLDKEAKNRGNSVYFPTQVVPMLPEFLSNGLCSLKPNEDRFCMVCEMTISSTGKLTRYQFYEGVMKSHARLTYTKVAKILEGDAILENDYADYVEDLHNLEKLYECLHAERERRGAIDFDTVETRISFGKNGKIHHIEPIERNVAHRIIEECMLCANVATARFLEKHKIPGLYRNHEGPAEDRLADLKTFLSELGLSLGRSKKPKPLDYGTLLKKIKNRVDANVIQTVLLRSLCQAVYSPDNLGHFGLAYLAYAHFTSPIRRYPDLIVHRQIKLVLHEKAEKSKQLNSGLDKLAQHCSTTERRADDAVRDVVGSLKCQYMKQHVGEIFPGIISGVTRFGFFVEIQDYYIEGLVHISSLAGDYFVYNSVHHKLMGENTGIVYSLGQQVTIQVAKVNTDEQKLDFVLIAGKKSNKIGKQKRKYKNRKK